MCCCWFFRLLRPKSKKWEKDARNANDALVQIARQLTTVEQSLSLSSSSCTTHSLGRLTSQLASGGSGRWWARGHYTTLFAFSSVCVPAQHHVQLLLQPNSKHLPCRQIDLTDKLDEILLHPFSEKQTLFLLFLSFFLSLCLPLRPCVQVEKERTGIHP